VLLTHRTSRFKLIGSVSNAKWEANFDA